MLTYLRWEIHSYGGRPLHLEIDGESFWVQEDWFEPETPNWQPLTVEIRDKIEGALEKGSFWKWDRSYNRLGMTDGTTWSIKVRAGRNGNRRKNSGGVNAYPGGWDEVWAVLKTLAGE